MNARERFLRSAGNESVDRPPLWIMRQAGRILPEYRSVREKHTFREICETPELAAEVTLQPLKRFNLDAAIIFSDILVVPLAMGLEVQYFPSIRITPSVETEADFENLKSPHPEESLGYVKAAIRNVRSELGDDWPVLGFSGAPYTLACYMTEGGGSKTFHKLKLMMHRTPWIYEKLMNRITDLSAAYLEMQVKASATAVQLFDSWAGDLSPRDYEHFVLPYVKRIIDHLKPLGAPVIYYINGIGNLLESVDKTGADVIGVDWRISLSDVRRRIGRDRVVQGNLDPALLFADAEVIRRRTFAMLDQTNGRGHIVNLGHGVIPTTPLEGVQAFIDANAAWAEKNERK